ncbi:YgaP family membrane protein [Moraxella marmotae]|uniref:YgaP family membrane protein n=1 Tax=Moraxella marmotae TaxID=3344520 RepID=UPI0035F41A57
MKSNLHSFDRILRLLAGVVLIGLTAMGVIGEWGYVGVVLVVTALINFCPLYRIFRFSTKNKD